MTLKIAIIGAGYSGIIVAAELARLATQPIHITLFEATSAPLGIAYSTKNPLHLLNVPTQKMSAFASDPNHFLNWVRSNRVSEQYTDVNAPDLGLQFMPRVLYGNYLLDILNTTLHSANPHVQVEYQQAEVIGVQQEHARIVLQMAQGKNSAFDRVVLAVGNTLPAFKGTDNAQMINNPWDYTAIANIPANSPIAIIGTGLTMIDTVISLVSHGHQATIYAISRRGLLSQPHQYGSKPARLDVKTLPHSLRALIHAVRQEAATLLAQGGDWRSVMESLRHDTALLWQQLLLVDKKRFLRHLQPYWDTHRHRIAPDVAAYIEKVRQSGQLKLITGRVVDTTPGAVKVKPRFAKDTVTLNAEWVINCSGFNPAYNQIQNPLVRAVLEQGLAQVDATGLGFLMATDGALLDKAGHPSQQFFTLGTPCRGVYWECIAVPDIRNQALQLAERLLQKIS